jgi:hypothetical protein
MSLSVTFRPAARAEFIEATAWYESQRPGVGLEFSRNQRLPSQVKAKV